jgi:glycosyltransferase involved in cell wall biosynthesis
LATGCAIIGSDTEPVREFITHERNGLLVPFHDAAALAEAVTRMLADAALAERLRAAARDFAAAHLDLAQHLAAMDGLVARVTGMQP